MVQLSSVHWGLFHLRRHAQDRLNDALDATKAALEGGIVPGGGTGVSSGTHKVRGAVRSHSRRATEAA